MVGLTSEDSLSEEAHKVVCHYYEVEGSEHVNENETLFSNI